jgi:hypothetical protein
LHHTARGTFNALRSAATGSGIAGLSKGRATGEASTRASVARVLGTSRRLGLARGLLISGAAEKSLGFDSGITTGATCRIGTLAAIIHADFGMAEVSGSTSAYRTSLAEGGRLGVVDALSISCVANASRASCISGSATLLHVTTSTGRRVARINSASLTVIAIDGPCLNAALSRVASIDIALVRLILAS